MIRPLRRTSWRERRVGSRSACSRPAKTNRVLDRATARGPANPQEPYVPIARSRVHQYAAGFLVVAAALMAAPAARADPVRTAEWPLDAHHYPADAIWQISRGTGVAVAVIDSGVAADHPDLVGQVLSGTSLLGDGGDGRTDTSGDSHGTAIAGIIAGTGGPPPGNGMIGLAPGAKILPVRVAPGGQVSPSTLAQGIVWAADHGAKVINTSLGSPNPDPLLRQAVTYALSKDAVLVASAGNQGESDNAPMYPAAFPGVMSVSGIIQDGSFWKPSESGAGITIAAPAGDIYSTNDQREYVHADGTSYAAAYVSAAAALIRAHWPHLPANQVIKRLIATTDEHHDQPDPYLGYGKLNPLAALKATVDTAGSDNPLLHPNTQAAKPQRQVPLISLALMALAITAAATTTALIRRRNRRHAELQKKPSRSTKSSGNASARPGKKRSKKPARQR